MSDDRSSGPRWVFLVLAEHPYGREMLAQLMGAGFCPVAIIEEASAVATVERDKFEVRMAGLPLAPSLGDIVGAQPVERIAVANHNDDDCHAALVRLAPELLVLGGTRILKPRIFATAPRGALNAHPGLLPEVRGSASVAWAIERDEKIGCTCHFIEAGIDTGPIVGRREIAVHRRDTYETLCHATTLLSATLMTEALRDLEAGTLDPRPQGDGPPAHRNMSDQAVQAVKRKLADGRYPHLVD